jgi:hypothetical protein
VKNLFDVEFRNAPGKGVFASGGLKFQSDEQELRRRYARVLNMVPLETLLGEAALWVLWPSTAAIWAFPLLLWPLPVDVAVLYAIGLFLTVQVAHMRFYSRRLNYAGFVLGNRALQGLGYIAGAAAFWRTGEGTKALALGAWLVLMASGVLQVIFVVPFVPILKRILELRPADQALENVVQYHLRHQTGPHPVR